MKDMKVRRAYVPEDEARRNCEDIIARECDRIHPLDRPKMLRELSKHTEKSADIAEKINERDGVPE